jgi:hypothetical protein
LVPFKRCGVEAREVVDVVGLGVGFVLEEHLGGVFLAVVCCARLQGASGRRPVFYILAVSRGVRSIVEDLGILQ